MKFIDGPSADDIFFGLLVAAVFLCAVGLDLSVFGGAVLDREPRLADAWRSDLHRKQIAANRQGVVQTASKQLRKPA